VWLKIQYRKLSRDRKCLYLDVKSVYHK
jgi:hypothetical protein